MVKWVVVKLSDREYQILDKLDEIKGERSQKLKELFINYLFQTPRLKVNYHLIKLEEKKDFLREVLESVWKEYGLSVDPLDSWDSEKFERIRKELIEVNVIRPMSVGRFAPTYMFKKPWLSTYNSVSKVFPDLDEFSQAYISTIYILDFLSKSTFDYELLKDAAIMLNEIYMFPYAIAKKKAHEFQKTLENSRKRSIPHSNDPAV